MTGGDPSFEPISELGKRLRRREFGVVELAEHFLDRLERLGPQYNAVVTVTRERALQEAREAQQELDAGRDHGWLHGIPYGVKDLLATSGGIPTTWGAAPFRDRTFEENATVVRRLREAGAVLVAKLAMVELAGGMGYDQANASFTGPGINPWNRGSWSGGSSSGPGAAVAAGLVPFAIGSETWGSITTPSTFCGVTGLRPTYGRVSRHGAMALSWTMDKIGPMCRTAADCGQVLNAIAGHDPADPTSSRRPYRYLKAPERMRFHIGVLAKSDQAQPEVRANFEASLEVLRQFAIVDEGVELPDLPYYAVAGTIIQAEMASAFEGFLAEGKSLELTAPEDRYGGFAPTMVLAKDYINALRLRRRIGAALDALFEGYDALVSPTLPFVANPLEASFDDYFSGFEGPPIGGAGNAAGTPAVSVPNGLGERGLPSGLRFSGRAWEENRLLALAERFQGETDWHQRAPDVG